jgi:hypothetical protein
LREEAGYEMAPLPSEEEEAFCQDIPMKEFLKRERVAAARAVRADRETRKVRRLRHMASRMAHPQLTADGADKHG